MEHQIKSLLNFLDSSPCNFYAVHTVREILINNGFAEKSLEDALTAHPGEKFFVTKNHSAIFAFTVGKKLGTMWAVASKNEAPPKKNCAYSA